MSDIFSIGNKEYEKNTYFLSLFNYSKTLTDINPQTMFSIFHALNNVIDIEGDVAECGVNIGGTASLIAGSLNLQKSEKTLFLFDSFCGMPKETIYDNYHKKGDYNETNLELVKNNVAKLYDKISFIPGFVETTLSQQDERKYSFVHIDVDLYEATKCCIEYFYPRMNKGGIIIDNDYFAPSCLGANKAIKDFLVDKNCVYGEIKSGQLLIQIP